MQGQVGDNLPLLSVNWFSLGRLYTADQTRYRSMTACIIQHSAARIPNQYQAPVKNTVSAQTYIDLPQNTSEIAIPHVRCQHTARSVFGRRSAVIDAACLVAAEYACSACDLRRPPRWAAPLPAARGRAPSRSPSPWRRCRRLGLIASPWTDARPRRASVRPSARSHSAPHLKTARQHPHPERAAP
eukprot:6198874-Pleurochrysis_carterae.AAC.2